MAKCKKIIAFIPARAKSKNIPLKNIKSFAGKPLIYWILFAAQLTKAIEKIYVSTDSSSIKTIVNSFKFAKVSVINCSRITATSKASTESAMLEFARKHRFKTIMLIQATSPLLTHIDLTKAINKYFSKSYDSMLSVVRQKRFVWSHDGKRPLGLNYDFKKRPKRQDFKGYLVENGSFYITKKEMLVKEKNKLGGKIGLYEMPDYTYHELDDKADWLILEKLAINIKRHYIYQWLKDIKVVILDVDGVLTDGGVYYSKDGEKLLKFSRIDGKGIMLSHSNKLGIWVVSAEASPIVAKRCKKLKIEKAFLGIKNKLKLIKKLALKNKLKKEQICFIGDDIQDIKIMEWAGFSAAPKNAMEEVKTSAKYVCLNSGGRGAVREVINLILKVKGIKI